MSEAPHSPYFVGRRGRGSPGAPGPIAQPSKKNNNSNRLLQDAPRVGAEQHAAVVGLVALDAVRRAEAGPHPEEHVEDGAPAARGVAAAGEAEGAAPLQHTARVVAAHGPLAGRGAVRRTKGELGGEGVDSDEEVIREVPECRGPGSPPLGQRSYRECIYPRGT